MSQLTHPQLQIVSLSKRLRIWLAVAAVVVAAAIPTVLIVSNDDSAQSVKSPAHATGVRFDGGPDEGTRGEVHQPAGTRFDGGPDEGTRGAIGQSASSGSSKSAGQDTSGARP